MNKEFSKEIIDYYQDELGLRVCPLNMCKNDKAKSICCIKNGGKHCRTRFWTCWKKYVKEE